MARTTQRNVVIKISLVVTVDVSPLDYPWLKAVFATFRARVWNTFLAPNPLMKSPITNLLSFPSIIELVAYLKSLRNSPLFWSFAPRLEGTCVTHTDNYSYKFGILQV